MPTEELQKLALASEMMCYLTDVLFFVGVAGMACQTIGMRRRCTILLENVQYDFTPRYKH